MSTTGRRKDLSWFLQLRQACLSICTENGVFVLKGLCLCPEDLKPGVPVTSALISVYRVVLL